MITFEMFDNYGNTFEKRLPLHLAVDFYKSFQIWILGWNGDCLDDLFDFERSI